ncbi:MAG: FAD binding domain-containing protein [Thermoplasmata archaeon]
MQPLAFEYHAPRNINDAISLLEKYPEGKILAGGQSLIPLMKLRIVSFPHLIDVTRIDELRHIRLGSYIRIGAAVTIGELESKGKIPHGIIREAASQIADPLVRNMGTVGGNISHGDPSNDMPAVMIALKAKMKIMGPGGEREVNADDFIVDSFTTVLEEGEMLAEVEIEGAAARSGGGYVKQRKSAGDFSIAGVASQMSFDSRGVVRTAGIGLTSVAPKPIRAVKAEAFLVGKELDENVLQEACDLIVDASDPAGDYYGSADFRKKVLWRVAMRALINAKKNAGVN